MTLANTSILPASKFAGQVLPDPGINSNLFPDVRAISSNKSRENPAGSPCASTNDIVPLRPPSTPIRSRGCDDSSTVATGTMTPRTMPSTAGNGLISSQRRESRFNPLICPDCGQRQIEGCALVDPALGPNATTVAIDDTLHVGEPDASAFELPALCRRWKTPKSFS